MIQNCRALLVPSPSSIRPLAGYLPLATSDGEVGTALGLTVLSASFYKDAPLAEWARAERVVRVIDAGKPHGSDRRGMEPLVVADITFRSPEDAVGRVRAVRPTISC